MADDDELERRSREDQDDQQARAARELMALGRQLLAIDIDDAHAEQILRRGHAGVTRGPSPLRFLEPMATAALTGSYLVWALLKAIELYR